MYSEIRQGNINVQKTHIDSYSKDNNWGTYTSYINAEYVCIYVHVYILCVDIKWNQSYCSNFKAVPQ